MKISVLKERLNILSKTHVPSLLFSKDKSSGSREVPVIPGASTHDRPRTLRRIRRRRSLINLVVCSDGDERAQTLRSLVALHARIQINKAPSSGLLGVDVDDKATSERGISGVRNRFDGCA